MFLSNSTKWVTDTYSACAGARARSVVTINMTIEALLPSKNFSCGTVNRHIQELVQLMSTRRHDAT